MASLNPRASWSREANLMANVLDVLLTISWQLGHAEGVEEPPRITRPWEARARSDAREHSKRVQKIISETKWEEV